MPSRASLVWHFCDIGSRAGEDAAEVDGRDVRASLRSLPSRDPAPRACVTVGRLRSIPPSGRGFLSPRRCLR